MSEKSSGCGCCPECTGGPDCTCGCPDCVCGDCFADYCCENNCVHGSSKFVLSMSSSIVGMLFLSILALLLSISFLDAAFNTVSAIVAADFEFLVFFIAGILLIIGIVSLKAGDVTEGILFSVVGLSVVLAFVTEWFGYGTLPYFDWIVLFLLFIVLVILFVGRDITFGIGVLLFFIGFAFALIFGGDLALVIAGVMYLLAGIVLLYVAITDWIFVETGADLPLL